MTLTQEQLKEFLDYNPETGVFRWKSALGNRIKIGDVAGTVHNDGYRCLQIAGKSYLTHRLAWLFVFGEWPKDQIDHINGDRSDNRISNLRDVTHRENTQNAHKHRNGHLVGTTFHKHRKKWMAQIVNKGKRKHLGYFLTELQAHQAYLNALQQYQLQA